MLSDEQINEKYHQIIARCREVFAGKGMQYGPVWAVYRWCSFVDQLWMKVKRVRRLEQCEGKIGESAEGEYMALINYALIFLLRLQNPDKIFPSDEMVEDLSRLDNLDKKMLSALYDEAARGAFELYLKKNHDYNNAWQEMELHSLTDLIITKILRVRNILSVKPDICRADVDEQLIDVVNYSVFALIKMGAD